MREGASSAPPEGHHAAAETTPSATSSHHALQVALVVAGGATNRAAAAALFLSPKTIEFHLAHIYRKLGVRTRTELAALAARRGWLAGPPAAAGQD